MQHVISSSMFEVFRKMHFIMIETLQNVSAFTRIGCEMTKFIAKKSSKHCSEDSHKYVVLIIQQILLLLQLQELQLLLLQ